MSYQTQCNSPAKVVSFEIMSEDANVDAEETREQSSEQESALSDPTLVTFTCKTPFPFKAPPITISPFFLPTGFASPVIMLSLIWLSPHITKPFNATLAPGKSLKAKYFRDGTFMEAGLGSNPSFTWRSILQGRQVLKKGC
ncbi:reverse transcriptase [Senna tora]|uniref:Reverse transcriptase n=1 Tax=Senna tora TaxID=362788 RepID=A0A834SV00_9FABA|nr:reverse transcriptase [Senna tora]